MTKYYLAEQVRRILSGGDPSASSIKIQEIMGAIGQVINRKLKADVFQVTLAGGETIPDNYIVGTYDSVDVEQYKGRARAKLPAMPVALPKGLGVYHVGAAGDPDDFYVPIPSGQTALLKTQPLINDVLGRTAYEVVGNYVIFHKDITRPPSSTTKVDMKLVVMDVNAYGDYDPLPIPADFEASVIEETVKLFSIQPAPDNIVDSTAEPMKYNK